MGILTFMILTSFQYLYCSILGEGEGRGVGVPCADPVGGGGSGPPPEKSQKYRVS